MLMREDIKAAIEAILFVRSERVELRELVEILEVPQSELAELIAELIIDYKKTKKGIQIIAVENAYVMCSNPEYSDILARMEKPIKKKLSPAAVETLSIIAYRQPVTRAEVDSIRGVKSDRIIQNLLEKELIQEAGYKDAPGKPVLYTTGSEFLRAFGLTSLNELPVLRED